MFYDGEIDAVVREILYEASEKVRLLAREPARPLAQTMIWTRASGRARQSGGATSTREDVPV